MRVELERLLDSLSRPLVILDRDLRIVATNSAYAGDPRGPGGPGGAGAKLIGQSLLERLDELAAEPGGPAMVALRASLLRVLTEGARDVMALQRYDTRIAGRARERYWHVINSPLLAADGTVELLVHQPEEVTDLVTATRPEGPREHGEQVWRNRLADVAPLVVRGRELRAAWQAEAAAGRLAAALAEVALQLASVDSISALSRLVSEQGIAAIGGTGGSLALLQPDGVTLRAAISATLGQGAQSAYADLPIDGPFPAALAARGGEVVLLPDAAAGAAFSPEMAGVVEVTGCVAWASIPLPTDGPPIGSLNVGWREPHVVNPAELAALQALAAQCATGLERIRVRQAEHDRTAATLRMAELMQRSLLAEPTVGAGLEVVVRYRPAAQEAQVGGDWYDAFRTGDGATTLVIGDVSGHDTQAAAAMSGVRNLLRGIAYTVGATPAGLLDVLDHAIDGLRVGVLATAVLARVDAAPDGFLMHWTNAGHPPPLLLRADGTVVLLRGKPDLLLGLDPDTSRTDDEVLLTPGDAVLLYTDGLVERRGASIDDGLDWLVAAAGALAGVPLDAVVDALLAQTAGSSEDDIALLAVRVS